MTDRDEIQKEPRPNVADSGVEIVLDDGVHSPPQVPSSPDLSRSASSSSSSFFEKTSENVNRALLDLFAGHPWFHPPRMTVPAAECHENPTESRKTSPSDARLFSSDGRSLPPDAKQDFYRQAVLYADKEGLPHDEVPFSAYFPTYSRMSPGQLDWYFYWRSSIRKKIFIQTQVSYVFLYLYELIHRIGFPSAEDALDQILFVWKESRNGTLALDPYLVFWVRDFILYYGLEHEYYTVVEGILGRMTGKYLYQECLLYFLDGERKAGFLNALENCSDYPVTAGRFYKDGYDTLLEDAVCSIFRQWNEKYLSKQGCSLMAALGGGSPVPLLLRPFESALFYAPVPIHREGDCVQNSKVTYNFFSRTIGSSLIPGLNDAKRFRKFTTGLLRTVESVLRDCTDFPWSIQKGRLPKTQLALIEKQCLAFYKERLAEQKRREKRVFLVDNELLGQLKTDSEQIRRHLIEQQEQSREERRSESGEKRKASPDDLEEARVSLKDPDELADFIKDPDESGASIGNLDESRAVIENPDGSGAFIGDLAEVLDSDLDGDLDEDLNDDLDDDFEQDLNEDVEDDVEEDSDGNPEENSEHARNPFFLLFSRLTSEQRQVLSLLCAVSPFCPPSDAEIGQELRRIAFASNTFPNVIMEAINELAVDCAGDCIIDSSGAVPCLYLDYHNQIKEILSNDNQ